MQRLARVGLTGGIGSGKSTVARMLEARGAGLVDSDAIAREITAPGGAAIGAIRERFGHGFIGADGALDRARMREHVFGDPARRCELEALLHPLIRQQGERRAAALAASGAAAPPYLLFDIPLLAESQARPGARQAFDRILVVDCPVALQLERVLARATMDRAQAEAVMAAQAGRPERLSIADDVLFNGSGLDDLERAAARLHQRYLALRDGAACL